MALTTARLREMIAERERAKLKFTHVWWQVHEDEFGAYRLALANLETQEWLGSKQLKRPSLLFFAGRVLARLRGQEQL